MTHVSFWPMNESDEYGVAVVIYTCDPHNKQREIPVSACIMMIP
jgi:hypothetical protein